jgi:glycosyltransferase involved in cell wall biosynthesis
MRIVLDMQGAQTDSRFRGIGRYSTALAQAIVRQAGKHDVWLAANGGFAEGVADLEAAFAGLLAPERICRFDTLAPVAWIDPANQWRRDASERMRETFLRDLQPDVVHISSLFEGAQDRAVTSVSAGNGEPSAAVTLYDLIPLLNPEKYLGAEWAKSWYASKVESLKRAGVLLSISEHARKEAIDMLSIAPERIVNISSAVSEAFRPLELAGHDKAALLARLGIQGAFVMYSGAMDPRKNVERLVAAFAALPGEVKARFQLVIAGKILPTDKERLQRAAKKHGVGERLVVTGYVSDTDLIALYNCSALYVFPSLHEGFGLPALEAMACGVPTIGSSTTSVPEVIGRADAMFDPTDVNAITALMNQALTDTVFAQSLREHALVQAAKFSWDSSAKRAIEAFETIHISKRSDSRTWASVSASIEASYQALIQSIGAVSTASAIPSQLDLNAAAGVIAENQDEALHVARISLELPAALKWRVEGPFDSSYSLALVNRELALALQAHGDDVALHSTEGPGDFDASPTFLATRPDIARLHARERSMPAEMADVASRLLYPPRVEDMRSRFNLLHDYAWEESAFPPEWVDAFNSHLQGISALSTHVEKILLDAGVSVPISVSEAGVDHWDRVQATSGYALKAKAFRFLHVSSCFPRKGADVLLKAYGDAFSASDDVTLVIKTFANPHNEIHIWLAEARGGRRDFPDVLIIEDDLPEETLKAIYEQCHVLAAPSRAEGFGLPLAEAMRSGLSVITTAWGGQLDFCNEDTAWLVDYRFEEARTHFGLFHSVWAEPDRHELARIMREVHACGPALREQKVAHAQKLLQERFKWSDVAVRADRFARRLATSPRARPPRIGWVSTWNTRCGIASYSEHLLRHMPGEVTILAATAADKPLPDGPEVVRCWNQSGPEPLLGLARAIEEAAVDVVVVQFQYGFFEFGPLADFLQAQKDVGRVVVVMMHATQDPAHAPDRQLVMLADALSRCDRVLVHGVGDLNRLKSLGLVDNVAIFPHGVVDVAEVVVAKERPQAGQPFVLASYGFFLPHKGLTELVEAIGLLVAQGLDVQLRMINAEYPVGESKALIEATRRQIAALKLQDRISLQTEYLKDQQSLDQLSGADLIVFPYQGTGESSSAAVRYGLATGRPVAVTPISIFDDVGGAVHRLPGVTPGELSEGIAALMQPAQAGATEVASAAARWRQAHRYSRLGLRLYNTLLGLASRGLTTAK